MVDDDASLRIRLEGRAELLEATRLRYRALVEALRGLSWRERLRRNREVLREVARVQPDVDEALALALRRMEAEAWPAQAPLVACVHEVSALREALTRLLDRRPAARGDALGPRLLALEEAVRFAPRVVLPGQQLAVAAEVFDESPEVPAARAFGQALEGCFGRPIDPAERLPFSVATWDALFSGWPTGTAALETLLARLDAVDVTGLTRRAVQRRARQAPTPGHSEATSAVLHACFWLSTAQARIDAILEARLAFLRCAPGERFPLLRYSLRREMTVEAGLEAEGLPPGRAALLEMAHELTGLPEDRPPRVEFWATLRAWARVADTSLPPEEVAPLLAMLVQLARVAGADDRLLPPLGERWPPTPASLQTALDLLRDTRR